MTRNILIIGDKETDNAGIKRLIANASPAILASLANSYEAAVQALKKYKFHMVFVVASFSDLSSVANLNLPKVLLYDNDPIDDAIGLAFDRTIHAPFNQLDISACIESLCPPYKRAAIRYSCNAKICVYNADFEIGRCSLKNISSGGALVMIPFDELKTVNLTKSFKIRLIDPNLTAPCKLIRVDLKYNPFSADSAYMAFSFPNVNARNKIASGFSVEGNNRF